MEAPRPAKPKVLILLGATATGKTRLAIDLALRVPGEVVNADSMQIYRSLDIMVAKATVAERSPVPHHCMDLLAVTDVSFNAGRFVDTATTVIDGIRGRAHLPIVVGGTHQYIEALLWCNYTPKDMTHPPALALDEVALTAVVLARLPPPRPTETNPYELLKIVDPLTANKLRDTDTRKIRRALEVYATTGQPQSAAILTQQMELRYEPCVLWLDTEKEALYNRLDKRVDAMLTEGLMREAKTIRTEFLANSLPLDFTKGALQAIGFKELEPYLAAVAPTDQLLAECVAAMKTHSRNYARTQLKWVKHHFRTRLPVFRIDTTHPERWNEDILTRALSMTEDFIAGRAYRIEPLPVLAPKTGVRLDQWKKYDCQVCNRELNGQAEWDAHIKSKGIVRKVVLDLVSLAHKAHTKKAKPTASTPPPRSSPAAP